MFWNGDGISLSYLIGGNFGYVKKRNKRAMLLRFANGELYFVLPPEQNQHGARDHACVGSFAKAKSRA